MPEVLNITHPRFLRSIGLSEIPRTAVTDFDGTTGTLIQKSGVKYDHVHEVLNITHPELIESFHRRYIDAGSDIVYANTFGANAYKLQDSGYSVEEIIGAGVKIARKAVGYRCPRCP